MDQSQGDSRTRRYLDDDEREMGFSVNSQSKVQESNVFVPLLIGLGVAGLLLGGRSVHKAYTVWKQSPMFGSNFYKGGFQPVMDRREASRILGIRASSDAKLVMERYRTLIKLNHPDRGGSPLLTKKINEAKEIMMKGKKKD